MNAPPRGVAPLCLPPKPMRYPLLQRLPAGTIDCHFHVFAEGAPLATPRSYSPQMLSLENWRAYAEAVGIAKGILVQPSVYGFDNSVLLAALAAGPERLRGVAVVPAEIEQTELERLHERGVRGVRCNTRNLGGIELDAVTALARRIAPLGWTLQFQVRNEQLGAIAALAPTLGVTIVIDHLGFVDPRERSTALGSLRVLLEGGAFVKLSAPYRLSSEPRYGDVGEIATALLTLHPDRILWGSDWPHTELWDAMPDDAELIDIVGEWVADDATRRAVFVETPQRLFFNS
jgi:predicted TIM-barrel fold metal-dependent hydrolase